jgi:hypothetical protein
MFTINADGTLAQNSTQAAESGSNQTNDFIGAAIHCSIGSSLCAAQNGPVADLLPDEPGSYTGYQALFGMKYVAPAVGGFSDYDGNALTGFSALNFNPKPSQTLAVVETMLKKGIPVVFAYIADAPLSGNTAHIATITTGVRLIGGRLLREGDPSHHWPCLIVRDCPYWCQSQNRTIRCNCSPVGNIQKQILKTTIGVSDYFADTAIPVPFSISC